VAWEQMDVWSRLTISIGAGLYEELMFRMLLIGALHTLLVDVAGARARLGAAIAIIISAAAFAWYHPLEDPAAPAGLSWPRLAFYFLAGVYFGTLFIMRGFGIVVGVHALYDIMIVLWPAGE
jgi:membrane protease YdiL (CAAX protease family)